MPRDERLREGAGGVQPGSHRKPLDGGEEQPGDRGERAESQRDSHARESILAPASQTVDESWF